MLSGLTAEEQKLKEHDREWGLRSTFYLGRRVLGYDFYERPHRGICNFVDRLESDKTQLLLDPRGCFKTSIISQAYVTRRIIKNPNIRILMDSVALTNSVHNLKVVRGFFEGNAKLIELYGNFHGKNETWNDSEFTVATRTNLRLKEATVTSSGIDKVQIGPHYDLIIADDLHNLANCQTVEQVQKVKDHIRLVFGLLDPNGEFIIAGHRWSYTDAYSMVMGDTDRVEELEFASLFTGKTYIHGAINSDGSFYFPDWGKRFNISTKDYLERQRIGLGVDMYSAMLLNEPVVTGEGQKFNQRYFKRFAEPLQARERAEAPLLPKLNWYLTIDPGGKKKGNDDWVIFEGAIDAAGNQYFTRYLKKVSKTSLAAEDVYRWWLQKRKEGAPYQKIGFEVCGQQGQMLEHMKEYLWDKYQVQLPFKELPHSDDSKEVRIEGMGPKYENGKIFHSKQMSEAFGLEDQLLKHPKGRNDVADAASMQEELAVAPRVVVKQPPPKNLDEVLMRAEAARLGNAKRMRRVHPILGSE